MLIPLSILFWVRVGCSGWVVAFPGRDRLHELVGISERGPDGLDERFSAALGCSAAMAARPWVMSWWMESVSDSRAFSVQVRNRCGSFVAKAVTAVQSEALR